ncbi:TonB-dependent receptor [Gramella lutea]|uniref:TonB-dependent receptor n=1 Tax=Christiangramia lutea TaxID=1607951 RepID=A0A9X1V157_9FLAO|nr:TonB-dependent receptor [Christiangramia lutea]MCH4822285.1 TonB-dependent receptor [Christiangramia lutea]
MKRIITLIICVFSFFFSSSQETESLDLEFENARLDEVFSLIEENSDYKFFFLKDWITDTRITKSFQDVPLEDILSEILEETVLNYYILDDRIIITENNIVHKDFSFQTEEKEIAEQTPERVNEENIPYFLDENDKAGAITTHKIGKESDSRGNEYYTLTGRVLNNKDQSPLSNVAILVEGENKGTQTDIDGNYSLRLKAGPHILIARTLGNDIVRKRAVIYNDGTLDFSLSESLEQLSEVIIDSKSDRNVKEAFTGVSVIDVQRIKTMPLVLGERDLLKAATTLPGISKAGEGALGFNIRGGREDQNLILLDDGVIYNPNHFFGIFSAINPFTTGSVEIYKGNIPAKYGGRLSSVFDIRTKKGNTQQIAGEGSVGPVTGNLELEVPIVKDKSSLILGGRATYSDWILNTLDEEALNNSEASFYDAIANYSHQIDENNDYNITGYYSRDKFSITSDSLYAYNNMMFSGTFNHRFNNDLEGSINVSNSNYGFDIEYDSQFDNSFISSFEINESKLRIDLDHRLGRDHELNYGLATKLYNIQPGSVSPLGNESIVENNSLNREKGLESALFISDEFEISDKFLLNAGLRFSAFSALGPSTVNSYADDAPKSENSITGTEEFGNNEIVKTYSGLEYRFGARYSIFDDFSVKGGYNSTMQYIHTLSNNTLVSPTDIYKLSDTHIKPQRAQQFSLGFFKNFNDNMYELSVEGYYKLSDDIIDFETGAALFMNENIETEIIQGEGKSYGAEFLLRKNFGDLNGWLSYTYSRSLIKLDSEYPTQRVNNGEFFPSNFDKPHDVSVVMNYKLTQRFSFSANFIYQTGRPVTYPIGKYDFNNSQFVAYSDRNQYRIPDYYRLDLSFNAEGNHKIEKLAHSFWSISIYNVLGRNNPYSVFFVTDNGEVKAYQSSIFAMPIPTITYNFKF